MRSVRTHADRLGIDHSHFTGQRRWNDDQLADAVASATSWAKVAEALGLSGGSSTTTLRGHALRLGLSTEHLDPRRLAATSLDGGADESGPQRAHLARAGSLLAGSWFQLSGYEVSWPLEPCSYDLIVVRGGRAHRVQVKTTTVRTGSSWTVWLSPSGPERRGYDPDEIDQFFLIDGDLEYYLVPVAAVGGLMAVQLSAYDRFRLPRTLR